MALLFLWEWGGWVCRLVRYADRLHEKEYYTAFLWVAIIKRKVCQRETLKNVASLCRGHLFIRRCWGAAGP